MTCPDCNERPMSDNDRRTYGVCGDCAKQLLRTWSHLDREYDRTRDPS